MFKLWGAYLMPDKSKTVGEEFMLDEKAKSKAQQKFMGMVRAAQTGDKPVSAAVAKAAKSMKKKDVEDYASTKHKGLPDKVKKEVISKLRELIAIELVGSCGY